MIDLDNPAPGKPQLAILISGSGSNLQAFIDACASGELDAEIAIVLSNKPDAYGLTRAANAGIPTVVIEHGHYETRETFDAAMITALQPFAPDVVILAGFMRILTPVFVAPFEGRMLNIHPSLLPKYPGLHTHQRALDAGDAEHGATVHFVTLQLDGGPPVLQARVPIEAGDTPDTLAARVLTREHQIFTLATVWLLQSRVRLVGHKALLDGEELAPSGHQLQE